MTMTKRTLSVVLVLMMLVSLLPLSAFAATLKITAQPKNTYVQQGVTAKVTVTAVGDGLTYQWYLKNAGGTTYSKSSIKTNTYSVKMSDAVNGRYVYCVVTDKYGNTAKSTTVVLRQTATIVTQPENTYVKQGETATLTVKAAGDGLTYQWYIKNAGQTKYSKSSVTKATYSIKMSDAANGRYVYCVVTDKYGNSVKSTTVVMRQIATIVSEPKNTYVQHGETATLTVKAAGDGLTYQWYLKNAGQTKYSKSSVTKATYSIKMTDAVNGRYVYCIVTDKYGNTAKTTTVVLRCTATILTQPGSVTVSNGETAMVKVNAAGEGLTYKWYFKDKGASKFNLTTSFKGNSYYVTMSDARNGRQVYCVVTDKYGNTVQSDVATLSKKGGLVNITTQPIDRNVVEGDVTTFIVGANGTAALTYQWQHRVSATGEWHNSGLSGNKTNTLTVPATMARNGYQYRCVITCDGSEFYSNPGTLNVTPVVTFNSHPADASAQTGIAAIFNVSVTPAKPSYEVTYQWQYRANSTKAWADINGTISAFTQFGGQNNYQMAAYAKDLTANGYQFRCAVTVNGITYYSNAASLEVWTKLTITPDPASGNHTEEMFVTLNESFTLNAQVSGGAGNYNYKWIVNGQTAATGVSTNGLLSYTAVFTNPEYTSCLQHETPYWSARVEVTDGVGNEVTSAYYHIHRYDNIYFSTEGQTKSIVFDPSVYVQPFYINLEGGNPEYIEYLWQYSFDGTTWADMTDTTCAEGGDTCFTPPGYQDDVTLLCRSSKEADLGSAVINNGGVWLRCKATDTFKNKTVYSSPVAWVLPPEITGSLSGTRLSVNVTGGMGITSYEWWAHQGQWYIQSSADSFMTYNSSRWDGYKVYINYKTGIKTVVEFDADGNILRTSHSNAQ